MAGNISQNKIYVDLTDRLVSEGGFAEIGKKIQNFDKTSKKSEQQAKKITRTFEKDLPGGMKKTINATVESNKMGEEKVRIDERIEKKQQRFNMNALGVMFAGMAMKRMFTGLNATSREWVGMNELMSTMMGVVTLPATMDLLNFGILPLFNALTNLPEGAKLAIGYVITALEALGAVMMVGGQMMLGLESTAMLLTRIGGDGTVVAGLKKIGTKLGTIAKFAAAGIFVAIAFKDVNEGQVIAALGMGLAAAGILLGGPGGIALMAVGVTLKLLGDEDFLVSVLKTMYKIGGTLNSIIKEALLSALTFRDFNVENIEGFANVKRAFGRAIEEIQQERAGEGVFDVIIFPENMVADVQEDIDDLKEEFDNDLINREEYLTELERLTEKQNKIIKKWRIAYQKNKDAIEEASTGSGEVTTQTSSKSNFQTFGLLGFNPVSFISNLFKGDENRAVGGKVRKTGRYFLHEGEEVIPKTDVSEGMIMNVTYNVNVSDKREFAEILRRNNEKLTSDVRRMAKI